LLEHPGAQDSVTGIRQWWLKSDEATENEVAEALGLLVEMKFIQANRGPNGSISFCLNQEKVDEIQSLLASDQDGG